MAQLSFDIQTLVNQVKQLKKKAPTDQTLIDQHDKLVELLEAAQDKEWNDNHQGYLKAKAAIEIANQEAQKKMQELSKIANTVEKVASVTATLAKAIIALAAIV